MIQRKKIIIVDNDFTAHSQGKSMLGDKYDTFVVQSGDKLLDVLEVVKPDLILLEVNIPKLDGYTLLSKLKQNTEFDDIPVIFLTGRSDVDSELKGLTLGATDYISKPFSLPLLHKKIETHLLIAEQKMELKRYNNNLVSIINEKSRTVFELQNAVISTVAELVECRDNVTGGHISRTQHYVRQLLSGMRNMRVYRRELDSWDMRFIMISCQLHDVGKIMIPDEILKKQGKLTADEFELVKRHPEQGARIVEMIEQNTSEKSFLGHAKKFALSHHEKWDGSGYPYGQSGQDIPLQGRIMAIADVYDALVSERPYKAAIPHDEARDIIIGSSGSHFDPRLIDVFKCVEQKFFQISTLTTDTEMRAIEGSMQ